MSEYRINQITNQAGTAGPQVAGITTFSSSSGLVMPSGATEYRGGRGRGLFGMGYSAPAETNSIEYITISTTGNALDFGDLTQARSWPSACASSTRGIFAGGYNTNVIGYVTISSTGNAFDFGDLTIGRYQNSALSSSTRGLICGTFNVSSVDYITISTLGNASKFGDLTQADTRYNQACASPTRGVVYCAGSPSTVTNTINFFTIATTGNAQDFGDLTQARTESHGGCSNSVRGLFAGGLTVNPSVLRNNIDYITIASLGDAQDFGDLVTARQLVSACASSTRGVFGGGYAPGLSYNIIEFVTIATIGNTTDFGDLLFNRSGSAACSDAHGGLGD